MWEDDRWFKTIDRLEVFNESGDLVLHTYDRTEAWDKFHSLGRGARIAFHPETRHYHEWSKMGVKF